MPADQAPGVSTTTVSMRPALRGARDVGFVGVGGADEQRATVRAAERARERAATGRDLVEERRRLRRRGRTDRSPGRRPRPRRRRRGRCRRASRRCRAATPTRGDSTACRRSPMSNAVRRAAVLSPTISVRPSGVMTGAVREAELVGRDPRPTVGFDREEVRLAPRLAAVHVEAEVADVGAAAAVDDHVVAVRGRERREIRVLGRARRPSSRSTLRSTIDTTSIGRRASQPSPLG